MKTEDLGMLILTLTHKDSGFYLVEAPDNPTMDDLALKITVAMGQERKRTAVIDFAERAQQGKSVTRFVEDAVNEKPNVQVFFLRNMELASENEDTQRHVSNLNHAREALYYLKRNFVFMVYPDFADSLRQYALDLLSWIPHKYQFESGYVTPKKFAKSMQLVENMRFDNDKDRRYIKELIKLYEAQLDESSDDMAYKTESILKPLADLYEQYGDYAREIPIREQIAEFYKSSESDDYANVLFSLGAAYLNSGYSSDYIEKAIYCFQEALKKYSREEKPFEWANTMTSLATAYYERIHGDRADNIEQSINCYSQVSEVMTHNTKTLGGATLKMNLANAYMNRIRGDRSKNIEFAIDLYKQALEVRTRENMPEKWATTMTNLAEAFRNRIMGNRAENIETAIRLCRQSLEVMRRETMPVEWAKTEMNMGVAYLSRVRGDHAENIEESIHCFEKALEVMKRDTMPLDWSLATTNLATAHYSRIRGDRADNIETAIRLYMQTLEIRTRDTMPIEWAETMNNLATAYANRIRGDRAENMEKAIDCYKQAMDVFTRDNMPIEWARIANSLANAYTNPILGNHGENIEEAIRLCKQALEIRTRHDNPIEWAYSKINLAHAFSERTRGDRANNTKEAIRCYDQALEVMTQDAYPLEWSKIMNNLGNVYAKSMIGEKAIHFYQEALKVRTRDAMPVEWAEVKMNMGNAYGYSDLGENPQNIDRAIRNYEQALEVHCADTMPLAHQQTQKNLGDLCMKEKRWLKAAEAFAGLFSANEILYKAAALPESRQRELYEVQGTAMKMAYALVKSTAPETESDVMCKAIEVLERYCSRWVRDALSLKTGKPKTVPDAVWSDFEKCRENYNKFLRESWLPENTPGCRSFLELSATIRNAMEMLDKVLLKVREYDPEFMPDPNFRQIRTVVSPKSEALVYFAVTSVGSVAFLIRSDDNTGVPILLEGLTENKLLEMLQGTPEYNQDYITAGYIGVYTLWRKNPESSQDRITWFKTLDDITNWLWDACMGPLTEKLVETGITHVCLIPQGLLGLLPLHAANTVENGKHRYALDDVCYTYAPNALSLATCREIAEQNQSKRLLAIDEPYTENTGPLSNSNAEVASICRHFTPKNILADEDATRASVLDALSGHDVFHFSCHGMADFAEPLNSGLLMANGEMLTLRDFLSTEGINARLAVLSACETGIPDLENADEVIGLPAGLVQAGVAGVVASLWSVSDLSTMMLMVRFYELWRKDNLDPPEALRQAQIWVRGTTNGQKAKYFGSFLPEFGKTNDHLPVDLASDLYRDLSLRPLNENDFEHPFYWAAFTYTGV